MKRSLADSLSLASLTALLLAPVAELHAAETSAIAFFEQKIRPVLIEHCYSCHSASSEASASSRVTATAMALGEAAGTAAALALKAKTEVALFDGRKVREMLSTQNAGPFTDAK